MRPLRRLRRRGTPMAEAASVVEAARAISDMGLFAGSGFLPGFFAGSGFCNMSDELDKCAAEAVVRQSEVAGDVVAEQRQLRRQAAIDDAQRSAGQARGLGERPGFAQAIREAAEVEAVASGESADCRVELGQVVERQTAGPGEGDFLPGRNLAGNIGYSTARNGQAA